ncbi:hypothetical protein [Streptomyces sp. CC210A]|uniref:hypothetical protein n=1 Tax=Streptomyces sp. CC210A TaxID=2898184 RepID=UPI001F395FEC|nr:hypothetical protein [Streptomyces sp. CC210A]
MSLPYFPGGGGAVAGRVPHPAGVPNGRHTPPTPDLLARVLAGLTRPVVPLPALEPVPVDGCDVCGALARQREEARSAGRCGEVDDCNRELAGHPHERTRPVVTAATVAAGARPSAFTRPSDLRPGTAVYDLDDEMPGVVAGCRGPRVRLVRPTGRQWDAYGNRLRPATDQERDQLRALARLHHERLKGMRR